MIAPPFPVFVLSAVIGSSNPEIPGKRYSHGFPRAGNAHLDIPLGCGGRA